MSHPENTNLAETFAGLTTSDAKVAHLAGDHFSKPASAERVSAAKAGLEKNGFKVHVVNTRADAFETLKHLIPAVSLYFCVFVIEYLLTFPSKAFLLNG